MSDYGQFVAFAESLAREAGEMMQSYFDGTAELSIETKEDDTPVTIADKLVNDLVIDRVTEKFPAHAVIGEEASNADMGDTEYEWYCDPIDGTMAFMRGVPTNVFSLALVHNGLPVVAAVYDPYLNKLYAAELGKGAMVNGLPLRVADSFAGMTTYSYHTRPTSYKYGIIKELEDLGARNFQVPSVAYDGTLLAAGLIDIVVFDLPNVHDVAAIKLIIEEAGGVTSDIEGRQQPYNAPLNSFIAASSKEMHAKVVEVIAKHRKAS